MGTEKRPKRPPKRAWTADELHTAKTLRRYGASYTAISAVVGHSPGRVAYACHAFGFLVSEECRRAGSQRAALKREAKKREAKENKR